MSKLKIAVIIGATRDSRFGPKPAQWIFELARKREQLDVELVDLKEVDLPFFNEKSTNLWAPSEDPKAIAWQGASGMPSRRKGLRHLGTRRSCGPGLGAHHKVFGQPEGWVGDHPVVSPRVNIAVQEVAHRCEAIVEGIEGRDGSEIFSKGPRHVTTPTGRLETRFSGQVLPANHMLDKRSSRPRRRWKVGGTLARLMSLSHHGVGGVLHLHLNANLGGTGLNSHLRLGASYAGSSKMAPAISFVQPVFGIPHCLTNRIFKDFFSRRVLRGTSLPAAACRVDRGPRHIP